VSRAPTNDARIWAPPCLPGVEALAARYVRQEFAPHRHDGVLIGIIEAGVHAVHCRGASHLADPGTVATLDADEVHRGGAATEEGWRQRMLYVPHAALAELAEDALDRRGTDGVLHFREPFRRATALAGAYRRLHLALEGGGEPLALQTEFEALTRAVLARFAGLRPPPARGGREGVARARDWLHAHLDQPCTLAALAAVAGLRRRQLVRAFRARHGLAPHQYLVQLRVDRARALLAAGRPATEVAAAVGFADQSHLVRAFKAHLGATPGRYLSGGEGANVLFGRAAPA
jgi:AraC-like DNA-binding protein